MKINGYILAEQFPFPVKNLCKSDLLDCQLEYFCIWQKSMILSPDTLYILKAEKWEWIKR